MRSASVAVRAGVTSTVSAKSSLSRAKASRVARVSARVTCGGGHELHEAGGADPRAGHGMRADRQKLHHGGLIEGETCRIDDGALRYGKELGHAAIGMNPQHADVRAGIGLALAASDAAAAGEIGVHRDGLADMEGRVGGHGMNLTGKLVPHHARVAQEGVASCKDMIIRAAQAHTADADDHFVRLGLGKRTLLHGQAEWLVADDRFHGGGHPFDQRIVSLG